MAGYGMTGKITAAAGRRDELVDILRLAVEAVRPLPGCIVYIVSTVETEPDVVHIFEAWRSKADHDASLENETVRSLIGQARPLIAAMEGTEVTPVAGKTAQHSDALV